MRECATFGNLAIYSLTLNPGLWYSYISIFCYFKIRIVHHSLLFLSSAVESYLSQGKDGELGVTGEGSLLDNAQGN